MRLRYRSVPRCAPQDANALLGTCFTMSSAPPEYGDFGPDSVLDEVFEAFGGRIMDGADVSSIPHPYRVEREELLPRELR